MKTTLTLIAILFSLTAMAQKTTIKGTYGKETQLPDKSSPIWDNSLYIVGNNFISEYPPDTVAVYMLTTMRTVMSAVVSATPMQRMGYSVTPQISYNSFPVATYLDMNKKPLSNAYIVWMSVPRKEECTCK